MSRNTILAVVVAIVVVGGGWYLMSGGSVPSGTDTQTTATQGGTQQGASSGGTIAGSATIGGLIALGSNLECTVTISQSGAQLDGTVYLSGGKMRSDFSTTQGSKPINSSTIMDGTYVYTWTDTSTQGYKTTAASTGVAGAGSHGGVDSQTAVKYSCKPWSPVASKFTPPSNVKF